MAMKIFILISLLLFFSILNLSDAYHLGGTEMMCWNLTNPDLNEIPCPTSFTLNWVQPPPNPMYAGTTYNVQWQAQILDRSWFNSTEAISYLGPLFGNFDKVCFSGDNCTLPVKSANCCFWHSNIHSCNDLTPFCGPWIPKSGTFVTQSTELYGSFVTTFHSDLVLVEGSWTIVAHIKFGNFQVGVGLKRQVSAAVPQPAPVKSPSNNSNNNTTTIIAAVVGGVGGLLLLLLLITFFAFRLRKTQETSPIPSLNSTLPKNSTPIILENGRHNISLSNPISQQDKERFVLSKLQIDFNSKALLPLDQPIQDHIFITNNHKTAQKFLFHTVKCPGKFDLTPSVETTVIKPKATFDLTLTIKIYCTTKISTIYPIDVENKGTLQFNIIAESQLSHRLDYDEIELKNQIGSGGFGRVYKATWRGQDVAVKVLKSQMPEDENHEFEQEIRILSELRSPYVVQFIGGCMQPEKYSIVTEFMPNGSLESVLKGDQRLGSTVKIKLSLDIARGMQILHERNIIHRDLKPDNLLVVSLHKSSPVTVKITDFGTSKQVVADVISNSTTNIGTPIYMAPEILEQKFYSGKVDLYSYAILLSYIFEGVEPYHEKKWKFLGEMSTYVVEQHGRPLLSDSNIMKKLIVQCWDTNPDKRPSFDTVIDILTKALEEKTKRDVDSAEKRKSRRRTASRPDEPNFHSGSPSLPTTGSTHLAEPPRNRAHSTSERTPDIELVRASLSSNSSHEESKKDKRKSHHGDDGRRPRKHSTSRRKDRDNQVDGNIEGDSRRSSSSKNDSVSPSKNDSVSPSKTNSSNLSPTKIDSNSTSPVKEEITTSSSSLKRSGSKSSSPKPSKDDPEASGRNRSGSRGKKDVEQLDDNLTTTQDSTQQEANDD